MTKLNYFIPFVFAIAVLGILEWFISHPGFIYIALGLFVVLNLATAYFLGRKQQSDWWKFALLPGLANIVTTSYMVILTNDLLLQILILLLLIFNYIYWRYVFYYLHRQAQYQPFSLENISFYISFIIIFLLGSLTYGLRSLLSLSVLGLSIVIFVFLSTTVLQVFWISKLNWKKNLAYLVVIILVLMEMFYMLSFLPLDHNLLGFVWATIYYVIISIVSDKLKDRLTNQKVKYLLLLTGFSWLVLFLSARWI